MLSAKLHAFSMEQVWFGVNKLTTFFVNKRILLFD
jgi:hypothetical protein